MTRIFRFTAFVIVSLIQMPLYAQSTERHYDIEVIAFSHAKGEYFKTEQWNPERETVNLKGVLDFQSSSKKKGFRERYSISEGMDEILSSLKRSSRYKLLAFKRWQQPGLSPKKAVPVRLASNLVYEFEEQTKKDSEFEDENAVSDTYFDAPVIKQAHQLDGSIRIELGRFLHIYTDLAYLAPTTTRIEQIPYQTPNGNEDPNTMGGQEFLEISHTELAKLDLDSFSDSKMSIRDILKQLRAPQLIQLNQNYGLQQFTLKSHRKTRSKQFQYIDHPLFGLIIRITPLES